MLGCTAPQRFDAMYCATLVHLCFSDEKYSPLDKSFHAYFANRCILGHVYFITLFERSSKGPARSHEQEQDRQLRHWIHCGHVVCASPYGRGWYPRAPRAARSITALTCEQRGWLPPDAARAHGQWVWGGCSVPSGRLRSTQ